MHTKNISNLLTCKCDSVVFVRTDFRLLLDIQIDEFSENLLVFRTKAFSSALESVLEPLFGLNSTSQFRILRVASVAAVLPLVFKVLREAIRDCFAKLRVHLVTNPSFVPLRLLIFAKVGICNRE